MARAIYEIEPEAFGLDISDQSFKFAQLKRKRHGLALSAFGFGDVPKGYITEGEIRNEDEVVKVLKAALAKPQQGKITTRHVVCSLPEEHSFTRVIQLPRLQTGEIKEAVRWEIEQNIPMKIDDVYYDWQLVETDKSIPHQDVLISAVPRRLVDGYVSVLKKCGFILKGLEVESVAVSRSLVKGLQTDGPILLVDVGATRTSFIIFSGTALQFTSSIPVAGNRMREAIANSMSVNPEEAKKLFFDVGLDKNQNDGAVYTALEPIVKDLSEQIRNYISFYEGHAQHEHHSGPLAIKKVFLCGGASNLTGISVYLSLALSIPVEIGNPWANILKEPLREVPGLSYRKSLSYTTVLGLALSGIYKD